MCSKRDKGAEIIYGSSTVRVTAEEVNGRRISELIEKLSGIKFRKRIRVFIEAVTVHRARRGCLVAEIQVKF